jgi:glycerol-3-phosphate acyltransferase PlsY
MFQLIIIFPVAYLLGSIPSSVWLGKALKGIDVRTEGSGNAGATNAFRVLGKPIGTVVLIMDMGKGYLAVYLSHFQHTIPSGNESWVVLQIALGLLAVAGHLFPLFAGFRGGKGVATIAGAGLALHPLAALSAIGVYLLVFLVSRVSALGSLSAVVSWPCSGQSTSHSGYSPWWSPSWSS